MGWNRTPQFGFAFGEAALYAIHDPIMFGGGVGFAGILRRVLNKPYLFCPRNVTIHTMVEWHGLLGRKSPGCKAPPRGFLVWVRPVGLR